MARGTQFPRKLKAAADPRDCFVRLAELQADVPGARAWGTAERGLTVNLGAGFDFGPLLTFGAPVVTAEVGAQLSVGGAQNLILMLERMPGSGKLTLRRMTGWSVKAELLAEAKIGIGVPEWVGETASAMIPLAVPVGSVGTIIEEHSKPNPLTEEEEGPEEPSAEAVAVAAESDVSGEDLADAGMEQEEAEEAEEEEPAEADKIVDLHAMAKAEAAASLRYFIVRDPDPLVLDAPGKDLDRAMQVFISDTAKAVLKEEVEEELGQVTADAKDTRSVEAALAWLNLVPEDKRDATCRGFIDTLTARAQVQTDIAALSKSAIEGLVAAINERYLLTWKAEEAQAQLTRFLTSRTFAKAIGSAFDVRPSATELANIKQILAAHTPDKPGYDKEAWKKRAGQAVYWVREFDKSQEKGAAGRRSKWGVVTSAFSSETTAGLLGDLKRAEAAGDSCVYYQSSGLTAPPQGTPPVRDLYDRVVAVNEAAGRWKKGAPDAKAEAATTQEAVKAARTWIKEHAGLVARPPERHYVTKRSTAELLAKVNEVLTKNPDRTELKALADELDAAKRGERASVKTRASQIVRANNGTLPLWPQTPSTSSLIEQLDKIRPPCRPPDFAEVRASLEALKEAAEAPRVVTGKEGLTYVSAWTFGGKAAAGVSAKAKLRLGLGANELGVHAKAGAEAAFQGERVSLRIQGFDDLAAGTVVHTQDVKVIRWSAEATAFAEAKVGNKGVAGAETGLKESGRIRWSAAMGSWELPDLTKPFPDKVTLLPGSGVAYGRSAGRERFATKLAALRSAQPQAGKPHTATAYVTRLARALRVKPAVLARALLEMYPTDDLLPDEAHETLYFESRWAVRTMDVKLRKGALAENWEQFQRSLGGRPTEAPPKTLEVRDLRNVLGPAFRKAKSKKQFLLQAIAVRVRIGDEPDEKEKTLFQVAWEYVAVATASVVRHSATRTDAMPDACTWWNLANTPPRVDRPVAGDAEVERWRKEVRKLAVPAAFVLDV